METHVVESVSFGDSNNPQPPLDAHIRITGERGDGTLQRPTQKGESVIDRKLRTLVC